MKHPEPPGPECVWNEYARCWDLPCKEPPCRCPHIPHCNAVGDVPCRGCRFLRSFPVWEPTDDGTGEVVTGWEYECLKEEVVG